MRTTPLSNRRCTPALLLLMGLALLSRPAAGGDLDAASDGEHLWLVVEDPEPEDKDQPGLIVYHLGSDAKRGQATVIDRLAGELMPRGLAAGDGGLLLVTADRRIEVIRPVISELQRKWVSNRKSLPALPDDCALVSIVLSDRGPWALVRVESDKALEKLDRATRELEPIEDDPAALNRALNLPEDLELEPADESGSPSSDDSPDDSAEQDKPDTDKPTADEQGDENERDDTPTETPGTSAQDARETAEDQDANAVDRPAAPRAPAYRLIRLSAGQWVTEPLPEGFGAPRRAVLLVRAGQERPSILAEQDGAGAAIGALLRYTTVHPAQAGDADLNETESSATPADEPAWVEQRVVLRPALFGQWSAALVNGQVVLTAERMRSDQVVSVRSFLLRGSDAHLIGSLDLPTNGRALWAGLPWRSGIALVGRPGPKLEPPAGNSEPIQPIAGLVALNLEGQRITEGKEDNGIVVIYEAQASSMEGNADLLIQIGAFITAMVMMMLFYRQAPRGDQLDLADGIVLASFGKRFLAGFIDLIPGFWIAGMIYDITINETILFWPGNGVEKVLPAMRPGFVVIAVTVAHTTLFEFITARSIGKWFTGLYVADLSGKPAPPGPSLTRALSRVFDLFAPLMLVLMVISPGRQRLGDILAKTLVVMREPEEREEPQQNDESDY